MAAAVTLFALFAPVARFSRRVLRRRRPRSRLDVGRLGYNGGSPARVSAGKVVGRGTFSMAEVLLSCFVWMIHWGVVLPLALIAATPYLAVASAFREGSWRAGMREGYRRVVRSFADFWNSGGWGFGS